MIVIVAPYSIADQSVNPHLGAANKIRLIIELLLKVDNELVLVNTGHNNTISKNIIINDVSVGCSVVREITPPILTHHAFGKLLNLFYIKKVLNKVLLSGKPRLLWLYNGYAFESLLDRKSVV